MSAPDARAGWLVHVNGRLVPTGQALLSAFDYGFLYGYGLFETMRAYNGTIFRLEQHLERLIKGAHLLGFGRSLSGKSLADACNETLAENSLKSARVRLTVSAGIGDGMPDPEACSSPTVMVVAREYSPRTTATYGRGFSAVISRWRRCQDSALGGIKSLSYVENLLAKFDAQRQGVEEALFLDGRGLLLEGSMSNVFIVREGALATPRPPGILPGITRGDVLNLARSLATLVEERDIALQDLFSAQEAFLTNSVIEVMPLTKVDGKAIGEGRLGPVTRRIAEAYRSLVESVTTIEEKANE